MMYQLQDRRVRVHSSNFIAPNATLVGSVTLEKDASVWFNVVIRADVDEIIIGEGSNIQDGSVLHVDPGFPLKIGRNVTVGHKVMLHGCTIGDGTLVGISAVVLNGAKIGKNCLIGANALVTENMEIPDRSLVLGSPAKIKKTMDETQWSSLASAAAHYVENGKKYNEFLKIDER